jgi:hydrogenase maturation protease
MVWQTSKERISREAQQKPPLILVLGLGNVLFQDDGVGVHLIRKLKKDPIPKIVYAEVGTAVLGALHLIEWADKILAIDAMQAGGRPGTIYSSGVENAENPGAKESLHGKTLLSSFKFLSRKNPPATRILGIEPENFAFGLDLSPSVQASLPQVIHTVRTILRIWMKQ